MIFMGFRFFRVVRTECLTAILSCIQDWYQNIGYCNICTCIIFTKILRKEIFYIYYIIKYLIEYY